RDRRRPERGDDQPRPGGQHALVGGRERERSRRERRPEARPRRGGKRCREREAHAQHKEDELARVSHQFLSRSLRRRPGPPRRRNSGCGYPTSRDESQGPRRNGREQAEQWGGEALVRSAAAPNKPFTLWRLIS